MKRKKQKNKKNDVLLLVIPNILKNKYKITVIIL